MSKKLLLAASAAVLLNATPALAAGDADLEALRAEIQSMRDAYESKIEQLEGKVETLEAKQNQTAEQIAATEPAAGGTATPATTKRSIKDTSFNPSIGVVVTGQYQDFSEDDGDIAGFALGEEGERGSEGLGLGETELNFAASIDDKFRGSATLGLHEHEGELELELEEAYIATTALPAGVEVKAGRFFSELGYLNSHHSHADDFANRGLPNRAFLDSNYGDDGIQVSAVLPTPIYTEVGAGAFRGNDFPAGGADGEEIGAWTAYGRVGGDVGNNTSWRLGLSTDGTYEDSDAGTGAIAYDDSQSGWYAQSVYKFMPQWRVGARYSQLYAGAVPTGLVGSALDDGGHNPWEATAMVDWTNSEFSRIRAQFSREEVADGQEDNQFTLQYIMSLGAHGAHKY